MGPRLQGNFDGKTYTGADGDYSVPSPVSDSDGKVVGDDRHGVTFRDDMGMRISFYSYEFKADSDIMVTLKTRGHRQAAEQFLKFPFKGIETWNFHPEIREGTVSVVCHKIEGIPTGVAAFMHNDRIYIVEFDLPRVTKFLSKMNSHEQEQWVEQRAVELAQTIQLK
jgi:hypothetical protein